MIISTISYLLPIGYLAIAPTFLLHLILNITFPIEQIPVGHLSKLLTTGKSSLSFNQSYLYCSVHVAFLNLSLIPGQPLEIAYDIQASEPFSCNKQIDHQLDFASRAYQWRSSS
jgi:hypothetical protein